MSHVAPTASVLECRGCAHPTGPKVPVSLAKYRNVRHIKERESFWLAVEVAPAPATKTFVHASLAWFRHQQEERFASMNSCPYTNRHATSVAPFLRLSCRQRRQATFARVGRECPKLTPNVRSRNPLTRTWRRKISVKVCVCVWSLRIHSYQ